MYTVHTYKFCISDHFEKIGVFLQCHELRQRSAIHAVPHKSEREIIEHCVELPGHSRLILPPGSDAVLRTKGAGAGSMMARETKLTILTGSVPS